MKTSIPFALLLTAIFSFFYIEQSYSAYKQQTAESPLSNQLCYLKDEHIRTGVYPYRRPYFVYRKQGKMSMYPLIKIRNNLFADKNTWELVGMETRIPPMENRGKVVEWYRYNQPNNNLDLLCQPEANQGHCVFKVVYEGAFNIKYSVNQHKKQLYPQDNVRVSIFGNNRLLSFPKDCKD